MQLLWLPCVNICSCCFVKSSITGSPESWKESCEKGKTTCCHLVQDSQPMVTLLLIPNGTRNLPCCTYAEFSKHVCLCWLNPLGTKSLPDPPETGQLKASFISGLWGVSNRPKDSGERSFSTCYHWGTIPKDPIGKGLNKSPSMAD